MHILKTPPCKGKEGCHNFSSPITVMNKVIYLMTLYEIKQITFMLTSLVDRANCNFEFF